MPSLKVWSLQTEAGIRNVCSNADFEAMRREFDLTIHAGPEALTVEEITAGIADYEVIFTGWGACPQLTAEFFQAAKRLRLICHLAGSTRGAIPPELVAAEVRPRGIIIYTGRGAIADNVAESTVGLLIATSHRWIENAERYRRDEVWRDEALQKPDQYLQGSTLCLLGASSVGRRVLKLLATWDLTVLLYDPYVSAEDAAALGAEKVELAEGFRRADLIADCLPLTPETTGLITGDLLATLHEGATFVNTGRGGTVDMPALVAEAESGRLLVGLDVTDPYEPPPAGSPWRHIPNLYLLPHVAGLGRYGYERIGRGALEAMRSLVAGRPIEGALDLERYDQLA